MMFKVGDKVRRVGHIPVETVGRTSDVFGAAQMIQTPSMNGNWMIAPGFELAPSQIHASAPELLEALQRMVSVGMEYYDMESGENGSEAIEMAQAAIAKALGKSTTGDA